MVSEKKEAVPGGGAVLNVVRPDVPSLTGLRFFAALFILLNHLLLGFVSRDTFYFGRMLANSAFLGMDIFFVLSGFIIHYNYSAKINGSCRSFYEFFVARFSRLYPLFIATFILDFILVSFFGGIEWSDRLYAIPFFITMSQSWLYQLTSTGTAMYYMFPRASIAWSVSTEMLMYAFYPLFWYFFLRVRFPRKLWSFILVSLAVALLAFSFTSLYRNSDFFDRLGLVFFGPVAATARSEEFSFSFWVWYISPYARTLQFLSGVVIAAFCLRRSGQVFSSVESWVLKLGLGLSLFYIIESFLPYQFSTDWANHIFKLLGYTPVVCFLIYHCYVDSTGWLSRVLSAQWCVKLGERSYSIYIWHIYFYSFVVLLPGTRFLHVVLAWSGVYLFSAISYRWIEKPFRSKIRSLLS